MINLGSIFGGLVMVILGVLLVKYSYQIMGFTGRQDWIERYVGSGSTNGVYKIFGVVLIICGILWAVGLGNNVAQFVFSPLTHMFQPGSN